jgi:hypothetical protein
MNLEGGRAVAGEKGDGNATRKPPMGIVRLFLACMVSGGIQYGWALQLSLLSPYSQVRHIISYPSPSRRVVLHFLWSIGFSFSEFALPHRSLPRPADSWDLAQLRLPDMDLRAYRRICGKCIFFYFFYRTFSSDEDEDFISP